MATFNINVLPQGCLEIGDQMFLWQQCQLKTLKTVVKMMVSTCPYWNLSLKSVHTACPSSSASSTDPIALQPTTQIKRRLQLEVQGLITWNEEITLDK